MRSCVSVNHWKISAQKKEEKQILGKREMGEKKIDYVHSYNNNFYVLNYCVFETNLYCKSV